MQIIFYNQTIPLNHIERNLTQSATMTGTLKEGCDVLNPDIRVNFNSGFISNSNYAYIADFGRYYYFREPPTIDGDYMVIHLHADALYNYRNLVLASDCIAERSSNRFNLKLKDSALLGETGYNYYSRSFEGGYSFQPNAGKYILCTGGK